MKKIGVGIIGVGRIGRVHTENIQRISGANIVIAADPFAKQNADYTEKYGVPLVEDYREVIEHPEVEVVYICSPTDTHGQYIKEVAQAGKHIFCEKPISASDEETLEVYEEVKKAGVKFLLGVNRRFDRNFSQMKEYIEEGKIGDIHLLRIDSRDPEAPPFEYVKSSGGLFFDMMIHDFDMARFLVGSEVDEVYAVGDALVNPDIKEIDVDTAIVTLKFKNGAMGVISNSRQAVYGYDQRAEVFGDKGAVETSNELESQVKVSTTEGVQTEKPQYFFLERYADAYKQESVEFFDAIINDTEPPVSFVDGIMAQRLAFAAKESLEKQKPVKVNLPE